MYIIGLNVGVTITTVEYKSARRVTTPSEQRDVLRTGNVNGGHIEGFKDILG